MFFSIYSKSRGLAANQPDSLVIDKIVKSTHCVTAAAGKLALDCLVEIHSEDEAREAIEAGARIIGINNRDLTTFNVDTTLASRLQKLIPAGTLTVAESGIKSADEVRELKESGVDAVLIGESLMRAKDRKAFLKELVSA